MLLNFMLFYVIDPENGENRQVDKDIDLNDLSSLNQSSVQEEIGKTDTQVRDYKDESGQYHCDKCEKQFSHYSNLWRHRKSAHEGIRHPCYNCNQSFTQKCLLKIYVQNIHEGVKNFCDLCNYVATQKTI